MRVIRGIGLGCRPDARRHPNAGIHAIAKPEIHPSVIPAKSLPRTRYGAEIQVRFELEAHPSVIPAEAGIHPSANPGAPPSVIPREGREPLSHVSSWSLQIVPESPLP